MTAGIKMHPREAATGRGCCEQQRMIKILLQLALYFKMKFRTRGKNIECLAAPAAIVVKGGAVWQEKSCRRG